MPVLRCRTGSPDPRRRMNVPARNECPMRAKACQTRHRGKPRGVQQSKARILTCFGSGRRSCAYSVRGEPPKVNLSIAATAVLLWKAAEQDRKDMEERP